MGRTTRLAGWSPAGRRMVRRGPAAIRRAHPTIQSRAGGPRSMTVAAPVVEPNPLREGLEQERVPDASCLIIFGASGDLTQRKLIPGLYSLAHDGLLPAGQVIIEKPFGHDLASARELNRVAVSTFRERQVFRIDHYLGKETVQNLMVLRFANGIFEPFWNRQYIDHVQFTVAESIGIEKRGNYFETAGISRDIIQNHMLQLVSLVAMEPPVAFEADAVRDEKVKVLRALREFPRGGESECSVRGQYSEGSVLGERAV